ncbi:GNAT family N-acetyltransferase [Fictibacillus sp. 18YEL24]|uniref:GNAT family N-acetyltransferase n=1 Tax=Fictibacillus sp. 18YEL24 TaxID=2745875 RepID=UPI0018CE29EE|nr:GNAT family N-acetyltransferase [Fictibacillus sp. 18YEL24]MBH0168273.1 GNAT family N-acetyltransferase [Fictibacillus sp. 18YEL24]
MYTEDRVVLKVEQFNNNDVSSLIELSSSVGWDYDENEIKTILSSGKIYGHKNPEGKIVSCAAIIPYDTNLASIGMVIVHSDYRGTGLGKEVTQQCIASVSKETSIMLISTDEGKPLYESLGFRTVDVVHKFLCENFDCNSVEVNNEFTLDTYKVDDFQQMMELDSAAFGDRRSKFLLNRFEQSKQCIVVKDQNSQIIGFGLSIQGPINLIVGPIVAPDFKTAASIMKELAANHHGNLRIDVPSGHHDFMTFLHTCGFNKVNEPPIMMKNSSAMPNRNQKLYGIAAQVFG